jgi:tetratricopeptide (TPR) repeat protein
MKKIIITLVVVVVAGILIFGLSVDIRTYTFTRVTTLYSEHETATIRTLINERRYQEARERITRYIDVSDFLSQSKSKLLPNIVEIVEIAAERVKPNREYRLFRPIFERLLKLDSNLYKPYIWLAKSLDDSEYEESIRLLDKAIELLSVEEDAYRTAAKIAINNNDLEKATIYCNKYMNAQFGEATPKLLKTLFKENGLRHLGLVFDIDNSNSNQQHDKKHEILLQHSGIMLSEEREYEFIPNSPLTFSKMKLYLGTVAGIKVRISKISIYNDAGKEDIELSNILVTSNDSYDISDNSSNNLELLVLGNDTEIISLNHPKTMSNVRKIVLTMTFSRLPFMNKSYCGL